jgi:polyisoprenoid-binding protein YceI
MAKLDASAAEITVFSFKEGLLSVIAHDLQIRVTRFELTMDGAAAVHAVIDASSLRVMAAVVDGAPREGTLSAGDKEKIEGNLRDDVLAVKKHPEIVFTSTKVTPEGEGFEIAGDLTLHGHTRPIALHARAEGARLFAEITLHQPDFGIKPYSAMLGTLKIKPDVRVRCTVPRPA